MTRSIKSPYVYVCFASIFGNFPETFTSTKPLFCIKLTFVLRNSDNPKKLAKPKEK